MPNRNLSELCQIGDTYYIKSGDAWRCVQTNVWQFGERTTKPPWVEQTHTFELTNGEIGALLFFALAFAVFLGQLLGEKTREAANGRPQT